MHSRIFAVCALALAAVLLSSIHGSADSASSDITAAQILQNHTKAVGYSLSNGLMKPYVEKSTTTWGDSQGRPHTSLTVVTRAGATYRVDEQYSGQATSSGFDGSDFWHSSPNGNVTGNDGYSRRFFVTWAVIDSEGIDSADNPQLRRTTNTAYVVRVLPPGGVAADIYFDKTTWLTDQVIVDPDSATERTEYYDYRSFGPAEIATTRRSTIFSLYVDPPEIETTKVISFDWNAAVTADDLSAPNVPNYATFPAGGVVTVPFDNHGGIIVHASVNGVDGRFCLDTGETGIVLSPLLAEKAGLTATTDARFKFFDQDIALAQTRRATIRVGDLSMNNVNVGITNVNLGSVGLPCDAIVGLEVIARAVTSIDVDHNTITFTDPTLFKAPPGFTAMPLTLDDGIPQTIAVVNNTEPISVQLATGEFGNWFSLGRKKAIDNFRLGRFVIPEIKSIGYVFDGTNTSQVSQGALGHDTLTSFNLIFDYSDLKVFLAAPKS